MTPRVDLTRNHGGMRNISVLLVFCEGRCRAHRWNYRVSQFHGFLDFTSRGGNNSTILMIVSSRWLTNVRSLSPAREYIFLTAVIIARIKGVCSFSIFAPPFPILNNGRLIVRETSHHDISREQKVLIDQKSILKQNLRTKCFSRRKKNLLLCQY